MASLNMNLLNDTVHFAVSYFDRFFSKKSMAPEFLESYGAVCLFIASKFNEVLPMSFECVRTLCNHLTDDCIKTMEADILHTLNFELFKPTVQMFCDASFLDEPTLQKEMLKYNKTPSKGAKKIKTPRSGAITKVDKKYRNVVIAVL